jgi:hypothetical protein
MKRSDFLIISVFVLLLSSFCATTASAQSIEVPEGYELVDSVVYRHVSRVDSVLAGKDIFHIMPLKANGGNADVEIYQPQEVAAALRKQVENNPKRTVSGYRVRIFFDNKQTARNDSEAALKLFTSKYHGVAAYRSYVNPYFKVTVGDFRTKSEAVQLMKLIQVDFPAAFVVKENIYYPVVDKENSYIVDTIKVLRPIVADAPVQ